MSKDWFARFPTRMQGKCTTQPDAANFPSLNGVPLVPTTSGQCLLLSSNYLLGMVPVSFWADNLYLRAAVPKDDDRQYPFSVLARVIFMVPFSTASVFLTNIIFQGDGEGSTIGIDARENVFVSGSLRTCGMIWCILKTAVHLESVQSIVMWSVVDLRVHVRL
jgi:hypothetical protein